MFLLRYSENILRVVSDHTYSDEEFCKVGPLVTTGAAKQESSRLAKFTTRVCQIDSQSVDGDG